MQYLFLSFLLIYFYILSFSEKLSVSKFIVSIIICFNFYFNNAVFILISFLPHILIHFMVLLLLSRVYVCYIFSIFLFLYKYILSYKMIIILLGFITPLWIIDKDRYCKECILPYKKYIVKRFETYYK